MGARVEHLPYFRSKAGVFHQLWIKLNGYKLPELVISPNFQDTRVAGERIVPVRLDQVGVLDAHPPGTGVQPVVAHRDDHVGRQRRRCFLAVEESVAWWQRRLLELDAHPMDRRAENVLAVSGIFEHAMLERQLSGKVNSDT